MIGELGLALIHALLYIVAWAWVLGFIPIAAAIGAYEQSYSRKRDLFATAALLVYLFAGYALFRWVIPAPFNPFR